MAKRQRRPASPSRNGTQAYLRVKANVSRPTARALASRLLANDHVQALVDAHRRRQIQELEMNAANALALIWEGASLDPVEMLDDDGNLLPLRRMSGRARRCIEGLEIARANLDRTDGTRNSEWLLKVKLVSKSKLREMIGTHYRLFDRQGEESTANWDKFIARINTNGVVTIDDLRINETAGARRRRRSSTDDASRATDDSSTESADPVHRGRRCADRRSKRPLIDSFRMRRNGHARLGATPAATHAAVPASLPGDC
jgi:hypothetical protein